MKEYVNQIEKFLRGDMNLSEETTFKIALGEDAKLYSFAFLLVTLLKNQEKNLWNK